MRQSWLGYLAAVCAVGGIWFVSAYFNLFAGWSISDEPVRQWAYGIASVCADVLKAAVLLLAVLAVRNKVWLALAPLVVIFLLCAGYSILSSARFASDSLMSRAATKDHSADSLALKKEVLSEKITSAKWLTTQIVSTKFKYRRDRNPAMAHNARILDRQEKVAAEIDELQQDIASSVAVVGGDTIARSLGLSITFQALFLALLLEFVSATGFVSIAHGRPSRGTPQEPHAPAPAVGGYGAAGFSGGPPPRPLPPKTEPVVTQPAALITENVVPLRAVDECKRTKAMQQAIAETYLEGGELDRVRYADFLSTINKALPPVHRVKHKGAAEYLMPALEAMGWLHVGKKKVGANVWVYGIKRQGQLDNGKRIADKLRVVS